MLKDLIATAATVKVCGTCMARHLQESAVLRWCRKVDDAGARRLGARQRQGDHLLNDRRSGVQQRFNNAEKRSFFKTHVRAQSFGETEQACGVRVL